MTRNRTKSEELLEQLLKLPVGTKLQKGNRQRILVGYNGFMVFYKTPSRPKSTTGQNTLTFLKWFKDAVIVVE